MKRVDVTGEICPRPALIVREELASMQPGDELLVEGDYPPAEDNLRRACTRHGFEVEPAGGSDETFELKIRATDDASIPEA